MNIIELVACIKPVKAKRLTEWLTKYFTLPDRILKSYKGTFTEVIAAKIIGIYKKRGCIEDLELNQNNYLLLLTCCNKLPEYHGEQSQNIEAVPVLDEVSCETYDQDYDDECEEVYDDACEEPVGELIPTGNSSARPNDLLYPISAIIREDGLIRPPLFNRSGENQLTAITTARENQLPFLISTITS